MLIRPLPHQQRLGEPHHQRQPPPVSQGVGWPSPDLAPLWGKHSFDCPKRPPCMDEAKTSVNRCFDGTGTGNCTSRYGRFVEEHGSFQTAYHCPGPCLYVERKYVLKWLQGLIRLDTAYQAPIPMSPSVGPIAPCESSASYCIAKLSD